MEMEGKIRSAVYECCGVCVERSYAKNGPSAEVVVVPFLSVAISLR
jgi:hypothetical protein